MVDKFFTWATSLTIGNESADVRWSLPWRKQRHLDQPSAETPSRCYDRKQPRGHADPCQPLPPSSSTLVYSSISDTKLSNSTKRIDLYPVSARLIREKIYTDHTPTPPERTGTEIQRFSQKSRSRLRFTAANSRDNIKSQFWMTYGDVWPINGRSLKADLTLFIELLRKRLNQLDYVWISEFQTRGAPHFHFFSSLEPTPENHNILTAAWYDIAGYGQNKVSRVHAHETNFIAWIMGNAGYLCKYLDKEAQKMIPAGFSNFGRFWSNSHSLKPTVQDYITADETKFFAQDNETPWQYLCRNLGKYHKHINRRSTVRKTPQSRTILTGASIVVRLRDHLFCPKPPQKGGEKPCKTSTSASAVGGVYPLGEPAALNNPRILENHCKGPRGRASRANGAPSPPSPALPDGG